MYFSHAYGYAAAITQQLRTPKGRADLLEFIDASSPTFRSTILKPLKRSLLHELIHDTASFDWDHDIVHWQISSLQQFFADHCETIPKRLLRDTEGNRDRLSDRLERPLAKLVDGAFYLLFGDRESLLYFNQMIATKVQSLTPKEIPQMHRPGILPRPTYIPIWLKKAVFHRDKGCCQLCKKDLTGLLNPIAESELDHIWPLAQSGCNDVTNFQLLCRRCNAKKRTEGVTSPEYCAYW